MSTHQQIRGKNVLRIHLKKTQSAGRTRASQVPSYFTTQDLATLNIVFDSII